MLGPAQVLGLSACAVVDAGQQRDGGGRQGSRQAFHVQQVTDIDGHHPVDPWLMRLRSWGLRQAQGGSPDAASGSKAEVRFLIGVTSSCCTAKSRGLRAAVRSTWLAYMRKEHPHVDVKFIIAQPDSPTRRGH